jgi:hypothetical protein
MSLRTAWQRRLDVASGGMRIGARLALVRDSD